MNHSLLHHSMISAMKKGFAKRSPIFLMGIPLILSITHAHANSTTPNHVSANHTLNSTTSASNSTLVELSNSNTGNHSNITSITSDELADPISDQVPSLPATTDNGLPKNSWSNNEASPNLNSEDAKLLSNELIAASVYSNDTHQTTEDIRNSSLAQLEAHYFKVYNYPMNALETVTDNNDVHHYLTTTNYEDNENTVFINEGADLRPEQALPSASDESVDTLTINPLQTAPLAPALLDDTNKTVKSNRCEGVWVTPNESDNKVKRQYQQAVDQAKLQDGLTTANGLPIYANADYAYYDNKNYVELQGNVEVIKNNQVLKAQQMALDLSTGIASMDGRVHLVESSPNTATNPSNIEPQNTFSNTGLIVVADNVAFDTTTNQATAHNVAYASVPMQAHGFAKRLNKPSDSRFELDSVMFTTCPPTNRKWQLDAQKIDIDTQTGRGEAYDATFRLKGVPVFYLPYFNFPVDDRRSSGLLTPSASFSSDSGLKISAPYYLNLSPQYDATITTDVYTTRNPMLTGEFRYLTNSYGQGDLTAAYLLNDKQYKNKNRRGLFYQHSWASDHIPRLSASAVYNYVSDPNFLDDFDGLGLTNNRLNLPRNAQVNFYNDYISTQFKVETFQSLKALNSNGTLVEDKDKPYSKIPQLNINYRIPSFEPILNDFEITGVHDSTYFKKSITDNSESEKSGIRIYNSIAASYPVLKTWGHLTPKLTLQHLYAAYDEESRIVNAVNKEDNKQSIFVPKFTLDSALNFYQSGSPFGWFDNALGGYQLLTPRLKYTYSPYENQTKIPNFDTRIASVDYNQLFADSWFLGYDRLPENNNLSVGLNYRFIDAYGITRFDGSIGDQFYLSDNTVNLTDSHGTTTNRRNSVFNDSSSGIAWKSSVQPYRNVWFDFNGALTSDNDLNFLNSQIRYQPSPYSLFNLGLIIREEDTNTNQSELSAITASTILPINENWRVMAQGQYDNSSNKMIDATLGIDYEDCCYGFSIYGRNYYNDLNLKNDPTRAIMAEFRINGLGNNNSRLSKTMTKKVMGFEPVESLWK